jgi:hypothetical protein
MTQVRSFDAIDLVRLPVLDASGVATLGEEILTRSKGEALPDPIARASRHLEEALRALNEASIARYDAIAQVEETTEAVRAWRAAWRAFHGWLAGWARLSDQRSPLVPKAKRLYGAVFHEGLRFVRLPRKRAWVDAGRRLEWLERHDVAEAFRVAGGRAFVDELKATHRRLGAVLGIERIPAERPEAPSIREPLDLVGQRLRQLVLQVAADADQGDATAKTRAARLLAPLTERQRSRMGVGRRAPRGAERRVSGSAADGLSLQTSIDPPSPPPLTPTDPIDRRSPRSEHAETDIDPASPRSEHAETDLDPASPRSEQAETDLDPAPPRSEHAETDLDPAPARTGHARDLPRSRFRRGSAPDPSDRRDPAPDHRARRPRKRPIRRTPSAAASAPEA